MSAAVTPLTPTVASVRPVSAVIEARKRAASAQIAAEPDAVGAVDVCVVAWAVGAGDVPVVA